MLLVPESQGGRVSGRIPGRPGWRGWLKLIGVLQSTGREGFDQLRLPRAVALDGVQAREALRAAEDQERADQQDDEAGPEIVAFRVALGGIHRRLGNALEHD